MSLNRHYLLGPWTGINLLVRTIYFGINLICTVFRAKSVSETGMRAGALALINMVLLFFDLYLSFIADLCGISLKTYRFIHAAGASV